MLYIYLSRFADSLTTNLRCITGLDSDYQCVLMTSLVHTPLPEDFHWLKRNFASIPLDEACVVTVLQTINNLHNTSNACVHVIHKVPTGQSCGHESRLHTNNGDIAAFLLPLASKCDSHLVCCRFGYSVSHACAERVAFSVLVKWCLPFTRRRSTYLKQSRTQM